MPVGTAGTVKAIRFEEFCERHAVFDVVLANLTGAALIRSAAQLVTTLGPSGRLIVSGVLDAEEADVTAAFASLGCRVAERLAEDEWIGLSFTSPTSSTASTAPR